MKRLILSVLMVFLLLLSILAYLLLYPVTLPEGYRLKVSKGQGMSSISHTLKSEGVILSRPAFMLAVSVFAPDTKVYPGRYRLKPKASTWHIIKKLSQGHPDVVTIRIAEGETFRVIQKKLDQMPFIDHTLSGASESEWLNALHIDYPSLEGLLFPDSYDFADGVKDIEVLAFAHDYMRKKLNQVWENKQEHLPYKNPYELLIMASIIERETAHSDDRSLVAAVFVNRLKIGMRLQTDPTVIYGMGERYQGKITRADLRRDTPYNTYTRSGLPPHPIAMPSMAALEAAAHPADVDYLYFVSRMDSTGLSQFSRNLDEHNRAVKKYILKKKPL